MANYNNNFFNPNQNMINQLLRQRDNIENMINQYSQPQQAPVQNIINTASSIEFEARILENEEDPMNIAVTRRTLFVDEKNKKVLIKEVDGTISKQYQIIVPLDEKDKKILDLEKRLKEMEIKINDYSKPIIADDKQQQSNAINDEPVKSTTKANSKSISKSAESKTS